MASIIISELTSTIATSDLEVPSEIVQTNDFRSLQNHAAASKPAIDESAYKDIKWNRLKGYIIPSDDAAIDSGIWRQGYRLYQEASGRYWWLCRRCHLTGRTKKGSLDEVLYIADKATSTAIAHLKSYHNIDKNGESLQKKRAKVIDDYYNQGGYNEATAVDNTLAASFDNSDFKAALYNWIITNNISFYHLESPALRGLLTYLEPRASKHIPGADTVSRTIALLYDKAIGTVTESLRSAITKINFSFDLWTSKNKLALLGLCAHFINSDGEPITTLLALPRQKGRHSGFNIAETVNEIIASYGLQQRLGYFTTDNASSNETCLDYIASEHGFERDRRWVRCSGHIFNLVGQAALFGSDSEVFSEAIEEATIEELELQHWRKKGPIGKLHNIVYWINKSPQRCERFEALQRLYIAPGKPDTKKEVYGLVKDVETRWNSFYHSAERACYLRVAIDELLLEEDAEYQQYCARQRQGGRPITRQPPPILKDTLLTDDWAIITQYVAILKPLKDATLALEGQIGGRFGAMWRVLPQYEKILQHFEELVKQYPVNEAIATLPATATATSFDISNTFTADSLSTSPATQSTAERHFNLNITLAWRKMNDYYTKLDNTPVYVAAVVLHPRLKWRWIEDQWVERHEWIRHAKSAFNDLIIEYEHQPIAPKGLEGLEPLTTPPLKRQRRQYCDDSDGSESDSDVSLNEALSIQQQLTAYLSVKADKSLKKTHSPIQYWLSKRQQWPHLTALALNVYSVAVMSDEPERVFSITGAAITPRRRLLNDDKINHSMCLKAWVKSGILRIDR
jgi:hypothetical protein